MKLLRWLVGSLILFFDRIFSPASPKREAAEQKRVDALFANMAIYEYTACPFCVKVRRALKRAGISIALKDAKIEPYRSELLKGGGKAQVPCLKYSNADGSVHWLYESNDIINFLNAKLAHQA